MADNIERELGRLESDVTELKKKVDKMQISLDDISATLSEAKGGWRTLMIVGGIAGALGSLITKLVSMLPFTK